MINIYDLKDPDDPEGRTYRELNNARMHSFEVGDLVEIEGGVRLFVAKQTRDCDGTPLYSLTHDVEVDPYNQRYWLRGFSEDCMVRV